MNLQKQKEEFSFCRKHAQIIRSWLNEDRTRSSFFDLVNNINILEYAKICFFVHLEWNAQNAMSSSFQKTTTDIVLDTVESVALKFNLSKKLKLRVEKEITELALKNPLIV